MPIEFERKVKREKAVWLLVREENDVIKGTASSNISTLTLICLQAVRFSPAGYREAFRKGAFDRSFF